MMSHLFLIDFQPFQPQISFFLEFGFPRRPLPVGQGGAGAGGEYGAYCEGAVWRIRLLERRLEEHQADARASAAAAAATHSPLSW